MGAGFGQDDWSLGGNDYGWGNGCSSMRFLASITRSERSGSESANPYASFAGNDQGHEQEADGENNIFYGDDGPLDFKYKYNDEEDGRDNAHDQRIEVCNAAAAERRATVAGPHVRVAGQSPAPIVDGGERQADFHIALIA